MTVILANSRILDTEACAMILYILDHSIVFYCIVFVVFILLFIFSRSLYFRNEFLLEVDVSLFGFDFTLKFFSLFLYEILSGDHTVVRTLFQYLLNGFLFFYLFLDFLDIFIDLSYHRLTFCWRSLEIFSQRFLGDVVLNEIIQHPVLRHLQRISSLRRFCQFKLYFFFLIFQLSLSFA